MRAFGSYARAFAVTWSKPARTASASVSLYVAERVPVSLGTDSPVIPYNPWHVLYHFTTRGTLSAGTMGAEYAVSREEALRLMTTAYAYQVFAESERGTLAPGMEADLTVLSTDYMAVSEDRMRDIVAVVTVVDGRIVHDAR